MWCALKLAEDQPGKRITVVERSIIPTGASGKNAGFSCFGSPGELLADINEIGADKVFSLVEMRYKGMVDIRKYFSAEQIDYQSCGGFECFIDNTSDWNACASGLEMLNENLRDITGIQHTFRIADKRLSQFGFKGFDHLIENSTDGGLDPVRLIQSLINKIRSLGVQLFTGAELTSYEQKEGHVTVTLNSTGNNEKEIKIQTSKLLLCTSTSDLIKGAGVISNRGQLLITSPIERLTVNGCFHFDRGFYYFRYLDNRLLIGGGRNKAIEKEKTAEMVTTEFIQSTLEDFINTHLLEKHSYIVEQRWSGIMGMSENKWPLVDRLSEMVYCCIGLGGMGVSLAPALAENIVELMRD